MLAAMRRVFLLFATLLLAMAGLAGPASAASSRRIEGTVGTTPFVIEVPSRWNGTVLLWSHGYLSTPGAPKPAPEVDNDHPALRAWLLDRGYAMAGTQFAMTPYTSSTIVRDQLAVLDRFTAEVARPRRVIAWGKSLGGQVTTVLAERHPSRISGALPMCAPIAGPVSHHNGLLDVAFALKTLLWADHPVKITGITDPVANQNLANPLIRAALNTPASQARLALAASFGDIPAWVDSLGPRPTDGAESATHLYLLMRYQIGGAMFGHGRAQLEHELGGNPSWNTGVDYRAQLAKSSQGALVEKLYAAAGLDLAADLATLNAAPRIAADPRAVAKLTAESATTGLVSVPTLPLHSTGDGTDVVEAQRWYADNAARFGRSANLRQAYVERANHCFFTAAEEIAALRALEHRLDTGVWGDTSAAGLAAVANGYGDEYRTMWSYYAEGTATVPAAFVDLRPAKLPRPFPW